MRGLGPNGVHLENDQVIGHRFAIKKRPLRNSCGQKATRSAIVEEEEEEEVEEKEF